MLYIIAICKNIKNSIIGYRIYDDASGKFMDVTYESMLAKLIEGVEVENATVRDNKVVGTNGDLKNYCQLKCNIVIDTAPLVVLKEFNDSSYDVIVVNNTACDRVRMSLSTLVMYSNINGLANASVLVNKNGTPFIRGIGKEIPKEKPLNITEASEMVKNTWLIADSLYRIDENDQFMLVSKEEFNKKGKMNVKLPPNIYKFGPYCFSGTQIKSIITPKALLWIGDGSFKNCSELESVKLNPGLKVIKRLAFVGCKKLTEIEIPATVEMIEPSAFDVSLKRMIVHNRRTRLTNSTARTTKLVYK